MPISLCFVYLDVKQPADAVGSWHDDYSPCCFALTLMTTSNYFLYGHLAAVFPDQSFSTDYARN